MGKWGWAVMAILAGVLCAQPGRAEGPLGYPGLRPPGVAYPGPHPAGGSQADAQVRLACLEGLGAASLGERAPAHDPAHDLSQIFRLARPEPQASYRLAQGAWDLDLVVLHSLGQRYDDSDAPLPERPLDQADPPDQRSAFSLLLSYDF